MRFSVLQFLLATSIYGFFGSPAQAHINTTFGPEISAEDFQQHAHSLSEVKTAEQQQSYLQLQFTRLGLNNGELPCQARGQMATLAGTNKSRTDSVVYFASLNDIHQMASVLEIAERFMTTKPRPEHTVHFIFSGDVPEVFKQCTGLKYIHLTIQPKDMQKLDSSSLVRELIALQRQGK